MTDCDVLQQPTHVSLRGNSESHITRQHGIELTEAANLASSERNMLGASFHFRWISGPVQTSKELGTVLQKACKQRKADLEHRSCDDDSRDGQHDRQLGGQREVSTPIYQYELTATVSF